MPVAELLASLRRQGFTLSREGAHIRVAPSSALSEQQRMALRAHKAELLRLLSCLDCSGPLPPDHRYRCAPCVEVAWQRTYGYTPPAEAP